MRWSLELSGYGYELLAPGREPASAGEFVFRARRPTHYGGPPAMIDVRELWVPGADPGGLGLEQHGCHLEVGGWHAQLRAGEEIGAMRLDVDRRKKPELVVHEHPFGRPPITFVCPPRRLYRLSGGSTMSRWSSPTCMLRTAWTRWT